HRSVKQFGAVAVLAQDVCEDRQGMHPYEGRLVWIDLSLLQRHGFVAGRPVKKGEGSPVAAPAAVETALGPFLDHPVMLVAISDQIVDRSDFEVMQPGKSNHVIHARHGSVIAHDFTD